MKLLFIITCFLFCTLSLKCHAGFLEKTILSDIKYQKNIQHKAYIASKKNIINFIGNDKLNENLLGTNRTLWKNKNDGIYLILRLINTKKKSICGEINCKIFIYSFDLKIPFLHGKTEKWIDFFIPLDGVIVPLNDEIPEVKIEWKKIYAK